MPKPTKKADSVSWTSPADAPNSRPMAGRLGRYMSMESGPNAASMASTDRKKAAKAVRGAAGGGESRRLKRGGKAGV